MIHNHIKPNPKASHGAYNRTQAGKRSLLISSVVFMKRVVGRGSLSLLTACQLAKAPINIKSFTTADNKRYHGCTTKHSAANPSRHSLDIFVPKTSLVNTQQVTTGTDKSITSNNRYTYGTGHSDVSCDGMSEPNKIPLWGNKFRGLNVVVVIPFYPFFTIYNKHTKHSGGHYHA